MPLFIGEDCFIDVDRRSVDPCGGFAFTGDNVVCTICFFPDVIGEVERLVGDDSGVVRADPSVWFDEGLDSNFVCTSSFRHVVDGVFTVDILCTFDNRFWSSIFRLRTFTSEFMTLALISDFVLPRFAIVGTTFNKFVAVFGSTDVDDGRDTAGALTLFGTEDWICVEIIGADFF